MKTKCTLPLAAIAFTLSATIPSHAAVRLNASPTKTAPAKPPNARVVFGQFDKDIALNLRGVDHLAIHVLRGAIKLTATTGEARLHVRKAPGGSLAKIDQVNFTLKREGTTLTIDEVGPSSPSAMRDWLKARPPEIQIELEAPALATEISLRDGAVQLQRWTQNVSAIVVDGTILAADTGGALRFQIQRGQVRVDSHRGRLDIDSDQAKVGLARVDGDITLTNFKGETTLDDVRGHIAWRGGSGVGTITNSSGGLDFVLDRGSIVLNAFDGTVRGETDQGSVTAGISGEANVHITSNQGAVSVRLPSRSGALVRAKTEEGTIAVPSGVRPVRGVPHSVEGRIVGQGEGGSVSVQSKSGAIQIR